MSYSLTRRAAADIRAIYVEGARLFGLAQAERYHRRLQHTFELLAANPQMARLRSELSPPMRVHPCGSHVILYVVDVERGVVIVRVRHGREDWMND